MPLLIQSPALAIVADGSVIAVRDSMGGLSIHPHRGVTLNHFFGDLSRAEAQLAAGAGRPTAANAAPPESLKTRPERHMMEPRIGARRMLASVISAEGAVALLWAR